jgi:hypothetical protein
MDGAGIYGVVTGHPGLCLPMRRVPGASVKLENGVPLSISGHFLDIAANSNKGYVIQIVVMPDGTEEFHGYYGRIDGTFQRAPSRDPSAFRTTLSAKFGVSGSMRELITERRQGTGPKKYRIDYYELGPQASPQLSNNAGPTQTSISRAAPLPERHAPSILEPRVARFLASVLSVEGIKRSMAATVNGLDFSISMDAVLSSEATAAARAAYNRGMAAWARYPDPAAYPVVLEAFGEILRNIAMRTGGSAYTKVADAAGNRANWHRIGHIIDLIEQATLSLRAATAGESMPAQGPQKAEPTVELPQSQDPVDDVRNFLYPGIFSGATDPQGRALAGVYLRPAAPTSYAKQRVADLTGDPLAVRYAALACDIVPGNEFDRRICGHFVSQSESAKTFECFSIYPFSNDRKAEIFAGRSSVLLVHGTGLSSVAAILGSQLDIKYCSGGRIGAKRIYAADDIRKSEKYASIDSRPDGKYRYFFVLQCLIPESIRTITSDLDWTAVESDPEVLIYADGSHSRGAIWDTFNGGPQSLPLDTLLSTDLADKTRGFFGDSVISIKLPGDIMKRPGHRTSFDHAEYTFGNNKHVVPRYIMVVEY